MAALLSPFSTDAAPFDAVAETYDDVFTNSLVGRAQRDLVWKELDRCFHAGQRILELNCGTGVDAIHLAERGVEVLACDAAPRMIDAAWRQLGSAGRATRPQFRVLATERINQLECEGPFDGAFSNFGGLNCLEDLSVFARDLSRLLAPGATALVCMFGRSCAWEAAWYLGHGNLRKALRRYQRGGTVGRLAEGVTVKVRYPSVRAMSRLFAPNLRLLRFRGVGVTVPPSYLEALARRFPRALLTLKQIDGWVGGLPVFRLLGDHILFEFQRFEGRP
jgi:ubiquinone/menaquinone biosynthesis C-methylase UbiE